MMSSTVLTPDHPQSLLSSSRRASRGGGPAICTFSSPPRIIEEPSTPDDDDSSDSNNSCRRDIYRPCSERAVGEGDEAVVGEVNGHGKLKRWLSVSVDDLQQLLRTAIIAAELGETKKNLSLSTGDNEEGGFVDFVDLETRIHLNKLSLIPVMVKHSFSIDEDDMIKRRSNSVCPDNKRNLTQQHSFEDPITGVKITSEDYRLMATPTDSTNPRLHSSFKPKWRLDQSTE
ncbi:uncharacterized protein LOC134854621 [Symsagittifera roscoffensis]|uniref:uncharacterized protein LOC134854621 n=1 Tax=Symsagittifera roscoffensis TaxID=84072 RepID=UPI00307BEBDA